MSGWSSQRLALALALLGSAGCDSEPADEAATIELEDVVWTPAAGTTLRYQSRWDWQDATIGSAGERVFETDLGYRVGVELGVLATVSVMLVPCSEGDADTALRSHTTITDSSELLGPWIEAFSIGGELELGSAPASGASYCGLHWLSAALTATTDEGLALDQTSIEVIGWFETPAGERREFDATVPLAAGGLPELKIDGALEFAEHDDALTITLVRRPSRALDGELLDELDDLELAYAFVYGLGTSSQALLVPDD
ncbi:hypothetical protein ACNOYE_26725 [Nannocystaceae bacterium ST9]